MSQGPNLHFFHYSGAMNFDGALTNVQIASNDLIGFALNDQLQDLFFTWCQFFDPSFNLISFE